MHGGRERPEAAMVNFECWILNFGWGSEAEEGGGGGERWMFNVECWILDDGGKRREEETGGEVDV